MHASGMRSVVDNELTSSLSTRPVTRTAADWVSLLVGAVTVIAGAVQILFAARILDQLAPGAGTHLPALYEFTAMSMLTCIVGAAFVHAVWTYDRRSPAILWT